MATFIESLTAMAVFAIGASASATWVAQSSTTSSRAATRVLALAVATDMEARLRANPAGVTAGDYQQASPAWADCTRRTCLPATVAGADLAAFRTSLARKLGPGASGSVRCVRLAGTEPSVAMGHCLVDIRWPGGILQWGIAE